MQLKLLSAVLGAIMNDLANFTDSLYKVKMLSVDLFRNHNPKSYGERMLHIDQLKYNNALVWQSTIDQSTIDACGMNRFELQA